MPSFSPVLYPPFNILRTSYVELAVSNLEASRKFYVDVLGLVVSHECETGRLYLRAMEERAHHSLCLRQGRQNHCSAIGFRVYDETDLPKVHEFFASRGLPASIVERKHMGEVVRAADPWGVPLEFYASMKLLPSIHQKYRLYSGVKPLRIDHVNLFSADVDAMAEFYNSLGFRLTEFTEDAASGRMWAAWMHRKGTVHDIAFTNGVGPRLHHFAYWVMSPMSIIDLLDLMSTSGYLANIERGPGRHGISNAFFLYVRDPDNHRIEFYCSDYQTIDPDHEPIGWDLHDPTRQTLWGAPAPRTWFEEGTHFGDVEPQEPVVAGTPIVAP
ncbi:MAG: 3,4-dihydroxyphenylacetate 2,3-dioxygenase [Rhodobacteraceae bacterium]|nr:3,4-dihydroxyphenylacetate 2,3-dioxygenase [Paracoccaceae bacterium]